MGGFGGAIGNANFQEPASPDQTSAPAMPDQQAPQPPVSPRIQSLAAALAKRKKQTINPTVKGTSALASAISRSKRAHQTGDKYGG